MGTDGRCGKLVHAHPRGEDQGGPVRTRLEDWGGVLQTAVFIVYPDGDAETTPPFPFPFPFSIPIPIPGVL